MMQSYNSTTLQYVTLKWCMYIFCACSSCKISPLQMIMMMEQKIFHSLYDVGYIPYLLWSHNKNKNTNSLPGPFPSFAFIFTLLRIAWSEFKFLVRDYTILIRTKSACIKSFYVSLILLIMQPY